MAFEFDLDNLAYTERVAPEYKSKLEDYDLGTYGGMKEYLLDQIDRMSGKEAGEHMWIRENSATGQWYVNIKVNKMNFYWKYDAKADVGVYAYPVSSFQEGGELLDTFRNELMSDKEVWKERVTDAADAYAQQEEINAAVREEAAKKYAADNNGADLFETKQTTVNMKNGNMRYVEKMVVDAKIRQRIIATTMREMGYARTNALVKRKSA